MELFLKALMTLDEILIMEVGGEGMNVCESKISIIEDILAT